MTARVIIARPVASALDQAGVDSAKFKQDFLAYKKGHYTPRYFGRDGDYSWPASARMADLWKIHISIVGLWPASKRQHERTSNSMVVYTTHFFRQEVFIILAFLHPDGHEQGENQLRLESLAEIAESVRMRPLSELVPPKSANS